MFLGKRTSSSRKNKDGHRQYDIALITEPPVNPRMRDLFIPSDQVKAYYVPDESGKTYDFYSAIYIFNPNLNWRPITEMSSSSYVEIEVTMKNFSLRICSIYCHNQSPLSENYKNTMVSILSTNNNKVIGGDFNAHHEVWEGTRRTDENGRFLLPLFNRFNWIICNRKGDITRKPNNSHNPSTIDLTIAGPPTYPLVKNWKVTNNSFGSDHICIQFEINKKYSPNLLLKSAYPPGN